MANNGLGNNVPSSVGVPGGAPANPLGVTMFLTQFAQAVNSWIRLAANAINALNSVVANLVASSGITSILGGSGISVSTVGTVATITATGGTGTVTSISQGAGITCSPNPITGSGTVALTNSSVTLNSHVLSLGGSLSLALSDITSVPLTVPNGGTGATSLTSGELLQGNGTSAISVVANGQLPATATNDNAASGKVGEYVSSQVLFASAVTITTNNTPQNLTSISLTAGDWDVGGNVYFVTNSATITFYESGISSTSATTPDGSLLALSGPDSGTSDQAMVTPGYRLSLASTTTVYLVVKSGFSAGNPKAAGFLWARRAR